MWQDNRAQIQFPKRSGKRREVTLDYGILHFLRLQNLGWSRGQPKSAEGEMDCANHSDCRLYSHQGILCPEPPTGPRVPPDRTRRIYGPQESLWGPEHVTCQGSNPTSHYTSSAKRHSLKPPGFAGIGTQPVPPTLSPRKKSRRRLTPFGLQCSEGQRSLRGH